MTDDDRDLKEEIKKGYEALSYVAQEELGMDGFPVLESYIVAKEVEDETNGELFSYMDRMDKEKLQVVIEEARDEDPRSILDQVLNDQELKEIFNVVQEDGGTLGKTENNKLFIYNSSPSLPEEYENHLQEIKEEAEKLLDYREG